MMGNSTQAGDTQPTEASAGRVEYPEQIRRMKCGECGQICTTALYGKHPFIDGENVVGCPNCFAVESLDAACYHSDCDKLGTIGSPNSHGFRYVITCHGHRPLKQNDRGVQS